MVVDVLAHTSAAPDAVALVGRERTWTYGTLDDEVTRRARELRAGRCAQPDGSSPRSWTPTRRVS